MAERLRSRALAPTRPPGSPRRWPPASAAGRDKLTLVVPDEFATFGLWLEQLIAESTGKDGTGIVPVVGEALGPPDVYGDDRLFVALGDVPAGLDALADAGHPVTVLPFGGEFADLGGQVLLWELATALAGALLGIQPFDQPDVAAAKAATAEVLDDGPPDLAGHVARRPARRRSSRATTSPSRPSSTPASPDGRAASRPPGWRSATA